MQYSVVNLCKAVKKHPDFRVDAEYYRQYFFDLQNKIFSKKNLKLKEISTNKIQRFKGDCDFDYLEISNISTVNGSCVYQKISKEETPSRAQKILKNKDVVISTVRPSRNAVSFINRIDNLKIASSGFCVLRKFKEVLPEYIFVLFKSYIFRDLLDRETKATMYPAVSEEDILNLKIPIFSLNFQSKIAKIVEKLFEKQDQSKSLYSQAEQFLLSELGLLNWKPKHELVFVKNFSDSQKAERFDAEYFQPKYEEIIEAIKKYKNGFDELGSLVKIKKSIEPGSEVYQENGIPFVRVSNLSKFELSDNNQQFISEELYNELKNHQPKQGEIFLSKDATPGMAYYLNEEPQKMIVSGGILRLKIDSKQVLPECLTLVLNSVIVQKQIERDAGGSIINHWRPDQVKATLIPILKEDKQKEIKELIKKSFSDRKLSKSLLEIAKQGVEMAIEKDEPEAEKWINGELDKLEIKF